MKEANEEWKKVQKYNDKYLVSNLGRVKSLFQSKERIMQLVNDRYGYLTVKLCGEYGKRKRFTIHRLVMITFKPIDNMDNLVIDHINAIKTDNRLDNLKWCTIKENNNNPITRKNISKSQIGRLITKEHKENMKKHHADCTRGKHPRAKKLFCESINKEFECMVDAAEFFGVHKATIYNHLKDSTSFKNSKGENIKLVHLKKEGDLKNGL